MKKVSLGLALLGLLASACQHIPYARQVKSKPQQGGVIALNVNHVPEDRQKAEGMMQTTCGRSSYKIVEEGEAVIGTETTSSGNAYNNSYGSGSGFSAFGVPLSGGTSMNSNSSTVQKKEWQITYECQNVASNAPTPAPASVAPKAKK